MINNFRNEYFFLSNFYNSPIEYDGIIYKNVEAAFQAQKSIDNNDKIKFILLNGKDAKQLGKKIKLRDDWELVKNNIMLELIRIKFKNHYLRKQLLSTENQEIIEGNYWHDNYWGKCFCNKCMNKIYDSNKLGNILMTVRKEIKEDI